MVGQSVTRQTKQGNRANLEQEQSVTGQQSKGTTANHQLNSVYDATRGDDVKNLLPDHFQNKHDANNIHFSQGIKYGGVEDTEDKGTSEQQSSAQKESSDLNTQSKASINKAGIKMPPDGAGDCKVLKKEPLVSFRNGGAEKKGWMANDLYSQLAKRDGPN